MRNLAVLCACLVALSSCALLLNGAHRVEGTTGRVPQGKALVIYGVAGTDVYDSGIVGVTLDQFSLAEGHITGNCGRYNRLEATAPADDQMRYYAFLAPPGDYVVSPAHVAHVDASAMLAFSAQAGVVSYVGDFRVESSEEPRTIGPSRFTLTGKHERIIRHENLVDATAFAKRIGLQSAPVAARAQPITGRGWVLKCGL